MAEDIDMAPEGDYLHAHKKGAQSISRSLGVLRILAGGARDGAKLVDIASRMDLSHPTAHRILKALEREGMVERVPGSRRYTIGLGAAWLGLAAINRFPIPRAAEPTLDRLAGTIRDVIVLSVPSGAESILVDRRLGIFRQRSAGLDIGDRRPLGVTIGSRIVLSCIKEEKAEALIRQNAATLSRWGLSPDAIREGTARARRTGYLCSESAIEPDRRVLAVPIHDAVGAPAAALSVIAPSGGLSEGRVNRLLPMLVEAAREISTALVRQRSRA